MLSAVKDGEVSKAECPQPRDDGVTRHARAASRGDDRLVYPRGATRDRPLPCIRTGRVHHRMQQCVTLLWETLSLPADKRGARQTVSLSRCIERIQTLGNACCLELGSGGTAGLCVLALIMHDCAQEAEGRERCKPCETACVRTPSDTQAVRMTDSAPCASMVVRCAVWGDGTRPT